MFKFSINDSGCYEDSKPCKKMKVLLSEDADDNNITVSDDKKSTPQVVKPAKVPEQPLPDPFPLHFSSEVELVLSPRKMTRETNSAFLSVIAAARLSYKRFTSREEYTVDIIR